MAELDFARARRQLRRARIERALGLKRTTTPQINRDRLLEPLLHALSDEETLFGNLTDDAVDTIVSIAVAEVDEPALDALGVLSMAIECLAADGQFARLMHISVKLEDVARTLGTEREALALACRSFRALLQGDTEAALEEASRPFSRTTADPLDVLCIVAVRAAANRESGEAGLAKAVSLSRRSRDAHVFAFVAAVDRFASAAREASTPSVLQSHDDSFSSPMLARYISERRRPILFPAQIDAIKAGVTYAPRIVVALPTSSGKTFLAELRTAASLHRAPGGLVIYVAPYRLLARQVEQTFREGLTPLGARVSDLRSSFDTVTPPSNDDVASAPDVIIVTPERLDALMRQRSGSGRGAAEATALIDRCCLIIFDELQLIGRSGRGPRLELILTRFLLAKPDVEFLGLSAASHGADDLSHWLTGTEAVSGPRRPTGTLEVAWAPDGELRQRVSGDARVVGSLPRSANALDDATTLLMRLEEHHTPLLAVTVSRQYAEGVARRLNDRASANAAAWMEKLGAAGRASIEESIREIRLTLGENHFLADCVGKGIAYHHAGLPTGILRLIEALAANQALRFVAATTTVAEGADLPFKAIVLPHLNFPGSTRRLQRDLYLNLIGRAGRAHVAVEGMVFILESRSQMLRELVPASLWHDTQADRVQSALARIPPPGEAEERWDYYLELQSQIMGWLGDGSSYVESQAEFFTKSCFVSQAGSVEQVEAVTGVFRLALADLEERGYALAASPYRLTEQGVKARLTGLSAPSVDRLRDILSRPNFISLGAISDSAEISATVATQIAQMLLETFEVLRHSLWLRRNTSGTEAAFAALRSVSRGTAPRPDAAALEADVRLLSAWILGYPYPGLGLIPPRAARANSLFGGGDIDKLTTDAAEYIGRITYPSGIAWSAILVLLDASIDSSLHFVRDAIELGVPNETAVYLCRDVGLSRPSAIAVSRMMGPRWPGSGDILRVSLNDAQLNLPPIDAGRVRIFLDEMQPAAD